MLLFNRQTSAIPAAGVRACISGRHFHLKSGIRYAFSLLMYAALSAAYETTPALPLFCPGGRTALLRQTRTRLAPSSYFFSIYSNLHNAFAVKRAAVSVSF
ncbi:hypothetical protein AL522_16575 [Pantoea vagans]|nr:hypothetical protein AL522_16575 [Pantoea vagans]